MLIVIMTVICPCCIGFGFVHAAITVNIVGFEHDNVRDVRRDNVSPQLLAYPECLHLARVCSVVRTNVVVEVVVIKHVLE